MEDTPLAPPVATQWFKIEPGDLPVGHVITVVAAHRALRITRTAEGYAVLDNRCPHQGGPLGEGQIDHGDVICPWHGYEYDPLTGAPPEGYGDAATVFPHEMRGDGLYVELPVPDHFALPAAPGEWAATKGSRKIVSISGDGGLGQYMAEFTTAVK